MASITTKPRVSPTSELSRPLAPLAATPERDQRVGEYDALIARSGRARYGAGDHRERTDARTDGGEHAWAGVEHLGTLRQLRRAAAGARTGSPSPRQRRWRRAPRSPPPPRRRPCARSAGTPCPSRGSGRWRPRPRRRRCGTRSRSIRRRCRRPAPARRLRNRRTTRSTPTRGAGVAPASVPTSPHRTPRRERQPRRPSAVSNTAMQS